MQIKIKIRYRDGGWKTFFVYWVGTEHEYEAYLDNYRTLPEAHTDAMFIVGGSVVNV